MAVYDFFLSRNSKPTAANYVGHKGRMFYDADEKVLRISDGSTPGGFPITPTTLVATTEPTVAAEGQMWYNPTTLELWCYHDGAFEPTIDLATETKIGGVKLGPGVVTNAEGQIIIDSTGLDFSFGNFTALTGTYPADYFEVERQDQEYAVLSSINTNEDIVLASNGTGAVRAVGDFSVRRANGSLGGALEEQPIFRVGADGQVRMLVPGADSSEGAVTIVGGLDGVFQAPVNTGVMLHITGIGGTPGVPSRVYNDAQNSFSSYVSRRYNGTAAAPTAVLDGEEILRLSGTAHNGTLIPGIGNARMVIKALGDQTPSNQGGAMEFWATPLGTTTLDKVVTVDSAGVTLAPGKVLYGNVNATSVTATNITVTGNITGNVTATTVVASNLTVGGVVRYDVTQNNSTATQLTSKSTTVVCNGRTGQIITSNSSLAKGSAVTFTVTNNAITAITDVPVVAIQSGATVDSYAISVTRVQVGSFNITLTNNGSRALTDTLVINFAIIKVS